jgi:hypothetical protein
MFSKPPKGWSLIMWKNDTSTHDCVVFHLYRKKKKKKKKKKLKKKLVGLLLLPQEPSSSIQIMSDQ